MDDEEIIGYEALWASMMKCKSGVIWKDSVAKFFLNGVSEIRKLSTELQRGTYQERPHRFFTVTSPKERRIMSISFRDRVYQRSLNDNAIYPEMIRHFIHDNGACQRGKGTDFARNRMRCHLQRYWRKHGLEGWILKMDVKGYYPNMRHQVAKDTFRKHLPENVYRRAEKILDSFPGEVGFFPGSQIIQIAGISVLDGVDHYVKERLQMKHYIRYMDDMIILDPDRKHMEEIREIVAGKLGEIGFTLHQEKTRIIPLRDGVMFLGFRFRLTETGKVILTVDSSRVAAERRKLRRMANLVRAGKMTREKVDQCYRSWKAHAEIGNSWKLIQRMDQYYQSLWRDEDGQRDQGRGGQAAPGERPVAGVAERENHGNGGCAV